MIIKTILSVVCLSFPLGSVLADQVKLPSGEKLHSEEKSLKVIINEFTTQQNDEFNAFLQEKRSEMLLSVEKRFVDCDKDNDDTLDVFETTVCLPQVARQFRNVDINKDNLISLDELSILARDYYKDTNPSKSPQKKEVKVNKFAKEEN
jgi:hypothetical protein